MVKIRGMNLKRRGTGMVLSPLESSILNVLWSVKSAKVRDIHKRVKGVALTSIAVSLDRLYKRGIVSRRIETGLGGAHYIYKPHSSKENFEKSVVGSIVDKLIENFGDSAITYFNERFSKKRRMR